MNRKFKITKVEVRSWSTNFTIQDLDHENIKNGMSPEGFIHHLGKLFGKELENIEGLEFEIIVPEISSIKNDPLNLCGKTITASVKEE